MKPNLYIVFSLSIFVLFGCISEERMNAATQAAIMIGAESCTVGSGTSAGTDGSYQSINLEFSNFTALPENVDPKELSLKAASVFLKNLKAEEYSGVDKIKVILNIQNSIFETSFDVAEIASLNEAEKKIIILPPSEI